jgi:polysaccharide biosynthesis protein PslH
MSYHANITAALYLVRDIMPLVWARRPDAEVWVAGKDPSREVQALTASNATKSESRADGNKRVFVTGTVPDLRPYLHKATIAVAPMPYGAGIQNKVLEAMACGAPVVASPQAASALPADPGSDLLVASGAEAFAEAILELLDHPERREQLGRAGRGYVERCHSWDGIGAQLESIYAVAAQPMEYVF